MRIYRWGRVGGLIAVTLGILAVSATASALPILGTVANANNYSLVHAGATPAGAGDRDDWLRFDPEQTIMFDFTNQTVSLSAAKKFKLTSHNGQSAVLEITALDLDLGDPGDGFVSGTLDYVLDGSTAGTFSFANRNYGNSVFNSSRFDGNSIEIYAWGGDVANALGIDLGLIGTRVAEPSAFALLLIGLAGLGGARELTTAKA